MYRLNGISLSDCAVWKNVNFKFREGVTDIRGGNRVGKSLLFTSLPAALYGLPLPKRGLATLDFNTDDAHVYITAKSNGKNNHYDISIDERDQKVETIADGRAVIDRMISIPESLFYTTVHVSGLNKHPLAEAKPSQRLEWVQQVLADSQVYDEYAARIAIQLSNLKSDIGKAELLKGQIDDIRKPDKPEGFEASDYTNLMDELIKLKPKVKDLSLEVEQLRIRDSVGELVEFNAVKYDKLKAKVARLEELREKYREYKASSKMQEKALSLQTEITVAAVFVGAPHIPPKKMLKGLQKRIDKAEAELEELEEQIKAYEDQADVRKDLQIDVKLEFKSTNKLAKHIEDLEDERRDAKRHIKLFKEGAGECPTCGHAIDKPQYTEVTISKLDKLLENAELQMRKLSAKSVELVAKPNSKEYDTLNTYVQNLHTLSVLCRQYVDLDYEPSEPVEYNEKEHKQAKDRLDTMREARAESIAQMKMLAKVPDDIRNTDNVSGLLKKKQKELSELNSRLLEINDQLSAWATYKKLLKQYKEQKDKFDTSLKELGNVERKARVLKALKAAFSRDGLPAMVLDRLVTTFVDQLNACAPLIWNEPFKFELDIGPRRCDVIAHRNGQAGTITTFSGSEQRGWQLVSALALLRILPNNKRFDTIILDELEANMDDNSQRQFVQDYLPELLKLVPKVVLVTPLSRKKLDISTDYSYNVIKRKSASTLEKV